MEALSTWVLSIAGVAVLTVLVDLILPEGQTNKYVKSIFSFVMVVIIISPLPNIFNGNFDISQIFESGETQLQDDYIYQLNRNRLDTLEKQILKNLEEKGIDGVSINVSANIFSYNMEIENVFVDLYHMVITAKDKNIDFKQEIKKSVRNYIAIKEVNIIFND